MVCDRVALEGRVMLAELLIAFVVVAICVVIHISGIVVLAWWILKKRELFETEPTVIRSILTLIVVFGVIIFLHMIETAVWAVVYQAWGLFPDFETSLYFSLTSYTTMGFGDVVLPEKWRLLGGLEGISGVLLCGISTAFIFVILTGLLKSHEEGRFAGPGRAS